jgi:hypothetical protein
MVITDMKGIFHNLLMDSENRNKRMRSWLEGVFLLRIFFFGILYDMLN